MDVEVAELLYTAYAVNDSNLGAVVNGISEYELPLIDIFLYIYDQKESGNITLDEELEEMLGDAYSQISIAQDQLLGEDYSRFVLELRVPSEGRRPMRRWRRSGGPWPGIMTRRIFIWQACPPATGI